MEFILFVLCLICCMVCPLTLFVLQIRDSLIYLIKIFEEDSH